MAQTPLYDALNEFAERRPLRLHMPGHKGRPLPLLGMDAYTRLDFTEMPATGTLYPGPDGSGRVGAIQQSEERMARLMGADACLYLTGGSTQGIFTMLALTTRPGDGILLDRTAHRALHHAVALLDLHPTWLPRPWREDWGLGGSVSPESVERALSADPKIKTICVTSPDYYGVLTDITKIGAICHRHGARLVVDGAHGAHLPFLLKEPWVGADLVTVSTHKTLPAPGQTALLLSYGGLGLDELERWGSVFGTSSPGFPLLAALDCLGAWLEEEGGTALGETARQVAELRTRYPALADGTDALDPCRLTLLTENGYALSRALQGEGIWPEMAGKRHVVCIMTPADGAAEFARLDNALARLGERGIGKAHTPPPRPGRQVISPREALFAPRETVPVAAAAGRIAALPLAPCPPGVALASPGEEITRETLAYLEEIGYNSGEGRIQVVR